MAFWLALRLIPRLLARVSNVCFAPRFTVATLSTPQTSGLSSFPASCTLPLWVGKNPATMLWTNVIDIGMGIVMLYIQQHGETLDYTPVFSRFGVPYLSISVSLNVLLTLMIVIRLVLHGRNIRAATGSAAGISGLYNAVSTMLIESCALFAVTSLVVVGALAWARNEDRPQFYHPGTYVVDIFFPILAEAQVCIFPRSPSPGQLSNVTTGRAGDRSATHHSTGRQRKRVDQPHYHHRTRWFV